MITNVKDKMWLRCVNLFGCVTMRPVSTQVRNGLNENMGMEKKGKGRR